MTPTDKIPNIPAGTKATPALMKIINDYLKAHGIEQASVVVNAHLANEAIDWFNNGGRGD